MTVLGFILICLGIASGIFAEVYQCILSVQKFGVIFGGENFAILIPHWSAWFFLVGVIMFILGSIFLYIGSNK